MEDKELEFRVAQMPYADKFQLHIYAALAEQERDFISQRTKAALAEAKRRGVRLGAPVQHIDALAAAKKDKALKDAQKVAGVLLPLKAAGSSLRHICDVLNASGARTSRGGNFIHHWFRGCFGPWKHLYEIHRSVPDSVASLEALWDLSRKK